MKNLKKVLAMVLAFACTFTMFASAKVYEDVQPGTEFSEAITMLSDLGIIQGKTDGKYHPEETITRAEACALIARLLTGDPNPSNFGGAQNFKDVVKGSWQDNAIGYCVANGVTVGVGNQKFEPNRAINDQEFITMLVRALGYETPDMTRSYPFSYMSVARSIGLVENTQMMANTDALRGEDAQVIYNAMFIDYAKGTKIYNTTHGTSVEKYPTLAESVWHLERAALGTFNGKEDEDVTLTNCKAHTWVIVGADKKEEGRLLAYPIDDDTTDIYESDVKASNGTKYVPYSFKYEGDADALKGYQVELYGEGKHGKPVWEKGEGKFVYSDNWTIKAIKSVKGQTKYDYDASKADAKDDNGTIELGESKLDLKSVAANAEKVTAKNTTETILTTYLSKEKYNGESTTKDKNVEKALNVRDGAQYKLMDWNSDGDIDWVVVDEANYFKVESANSKRLTVTSMKSSDKDGDEEKQTASETQTWKIGDLNDEKNYKVKYEVPEGVKEGDILEVTYKTAYDKGEKCEVVTATVKVVDAENHELDKVSTKDHLVLTFDGETKQLAQNKDKADTIVPENPSKYEDFDEEELGTQFALYMNRNGFIVYSDYATETSNYMMVLDTEDGNDGVRGELGAMNILTSDNKVEKGVEVVSDLRIDGDSKNNGYNKDGRKFTETKIVGKVFKYWKDADGKITKMESAIELGTNKDGIKANSYDYVSKNDRLTLDNKSYALKDAKVIFAVKPHNTANGGYDYIQYVRGGGGVNPINLKVDADDVLAVKAADIPDIGKNEDTKNHELDSHVSATNSWINDHAATVAIDADKNKDINAAILGVNHFNKFNAGSTKVGLVTNVSYGKGDIVSIDVATNGKVETLSSAEKTDFDDVVSVLEYTNKSDTKSHSVASSKEKINNGLMTGSTLKDYLNKNGAYAEITTNSDGKLTEVLFMDKKKDLDGASNEVNDGNVVAGNYYQVSRKVIADVKEGSWMSVIKGAATYANKDNFKTLDTKDEQKAADFTSDVAYYTIDGKPTKHTGAYENSKATILDGFDGNPDVKVGEASDVKKSDIRNDDDSANDIYNVADVASKIDDKGEGDIVAVYAYDDDMGEKIGLKMGTVQLQGAVTAGQETTINVTLPKDENMDSTDVYVDVVDKDNNIVIKKVKVEKDGTLILDTKALAVGDYTVKLYGYNKLDKGYDLIGSTTLAVNPVKTYEVTGIQWAKDENGAESKVPYIQAGTDSSFFVKLAVTGTEAVPVLTAKDLEVRVKDQPKEFEVSKAAGDNVFKIVVKGTTIGNGDQVNVALKAGGTLTFAGTAAPTVGGHAQQGTLPPAISEDAANAGTVLVKIDPKNQDQLVVKVIEGDGRARIAGEEMINLKPGDFQVTVKGKPITGLKVSDYDVSVGGYILTGVANWSAPNMKGFIVTVGTAKSAPVEKFEAKIEGENTATFVKGANGTNITFTPTLINLFKNDVRLESSAPEYVKYDETTGIITVSATNLEQQSNQVQFTLESIADTNVKLQYTIKVQTAPTLTLSDGAEVSITALAPDQTKGVTINNKESSDEVVIAATAEGLETAKSTVVQKGVTLSTVEASGTKLKAEVTAPADVDAAKITFYVGVKRDNKIYDKKTFDVKITKLTSSVVVKDDSTPPELNAEPSASKNTILTFKLKKQGDAALDQAQVQKILDIPANGAEGFSVTGGGDGISVASVAVESDGKIKLTLNKAATAQITGVTLKGKANICEDLTYSQWNVTTK